MAYSWLADLVMLAHFGFLVYVALGGFLAWRRPRWLVPHGLAVLWGALTVTVGLVCPLTAVENWARRRAGDEGLPRGFIDTYLTDVVYPGQYQLAAQLLVAGLVAVSWLGLPLWRRQRSAPRRPGGTSGGTGGRPSGVGGGSPER